MNMHVDRYEQERSIARTSAALSGGNLNQAMTQTRQPQVQASADRIGTLTSDLDAALKELIQRLGSVLLSRTVMGAASGNSQQVPEPARCTLAQRLESTAGRLQAAIVVVNQLTSELEI